MDCGVISHESAGGAQPPFPPPDLGLALWLLPAGIGGSEPPRSQHITAAQLLLLHVSAAQFLKLGYKFSALPQAARGCGAPSRFRGREWSRRWDQFCAAARAVCRARVPGVSPGGTGRQAGRAPEHIARPEWTHRLAAGGAPSVNCRSPSLECQKALPHREYLREGCPRTCRACWRKSSTEAGGSTPVGPHAADGVGGQRELPLEPMRLFQISHCAFVVGDLNLEHAAEHYSGAEFGNWPMPKFNMSMPTAEEL